MTRAVLAGAALLALAAPAAGQRDTVAVAGPQYRAGALKRALLGSSYRDLWTTPVRVPVLDLGTFAGGLTPTEEGGGNQTVSLRFRGADGREYAFRSVDKFPGRRAGRAAGPAAYFVQDQVSSQLPAPGVMAARLMDATGALHVHPVLYAMPDDPRLGAFRERFAGMLGQMEHRPDDGFAGSDDLEKTDDFLEEIEASPRDRVDAREYLAVRLLDLVIGDWDRHGGQYRWARFDSGGERLWRPVPRDRDYAFVDYDGLLLDLARGFLPKTVRFGQRIGRLYGLVEQGQFLDRRLLGGLERTAWDSAADRVRTRLTDALIDDAVARLPAAQQALRGEQLRATLRARRDDLPRAAAEFYRMMAREPEVYGTDVAEIAVIERTREGLEVRIHRRDAPDAPPHVRRRFDASETREVRVFLQGGEDRAAVTGTGPILARVVGGGGDDRLEDRGTGRTAFYDDRGENTFVRGARTTVDTRDYEVPDWVLGAPDGGGPPRDWGTRVSTLSPFATLRPHAGVVLGVGPRRTRYGFRRHPEAVDGWARVLWSPARGRFGVEARHQRRRTGSDDVGYLFGRASEIEAVAFRGFGNDAPSHRGERGVVVWERQLLAEAGVVLPRPGGLTLRAAGLVRRTDPERAADAPGGPARGVDEAWWAAGGRAGAALDRRDTLAFTRSGWTVGLSADVFPVSSLDGGAFGRGGAVGTAYLPLGAGPVLALRAGGEAAWRAFPVQHAAFMGSSTTVRGLGEQRYAGDRSAFGTAELRQPLGGAFGVFAFADAGRVWYRGRSEGGWHTALGGGTWAAAGANAASVAVAFGEVPAVYFAFGLPF